MPGVEWGDMETDGRLGRAPGGGGLQRLIDQAARMFRISECDCVQAYVMSLPFDDETFDYVYSIGVLHHFLVHPLHFAKSSPKRSMAVVYQCICTGNDAG